MKPAAALLLPMLLLSGCASEPREEPARAEAAVPDEVFPTGPAGAQARASQVGPISLAAGFWQAAVDKNFAAMVDVYDPEEFQALAKLHRTDIAGAKAILETNLRNFYEQREYEVVSFRIVEYDGEDNGISNVTVEVVQTFGEKELTVTQRMICLLRDGRWVLDSQSLK